MLIRSGDKEDSLAPTTDMFVSIAPGETKLEVTAPAVFVGFGVHAPELGCDDYAGVDLKGKIAVIFSGAPKRFPSEQRAHYGQRDLKRNLLAQAGAVGIITVATPWDEARQPWAITSAQGRFPGMRLIDAQGNVVDGTPTVRATGAVSNANASRVFVGAPKTLAEIFATAEKGEAQNFPLPVTITLAGESSVRQVESFNLLGRLPGSDPALAGEPLVITGHLDHLGIGAAVNGDTIYNGALDNGMGISVLLHVAEELASGPRLRRPVVFAAVCGEEKGLLGSRHLANHPPAWITRYAAEINIDMPLLINPVRDVVAFGAEHSTIKGVLETVAARQGFTVSPDPEPDEVRFVRSDQYSFVLKGVPAIALAAGEKPVDPGFARKPTLTAWRKERYHKPSDDLAQPIDWPSAGAYAVLLTDLIRTMANDPVAPSWLPGDFFGEIFGKQR
jgi:Zn-dependent M28 family amino/carboxypeptidase